MRFAKSAGTIRQAGGRDPSRMYLAAEGECKTFTVRTVMVLFFCLKGVNVS